MNLECTGPFSISIMHTAHFKILYLYVCLTFHLTLAQLKHFVTNTYLYMEWVKSTFELEMSTHLKRKLILMFLGQRSYY